MAKRFHKQSAQSEKARVGCLQGLIRMFHIRHSTRNSLQDKKDVTCRRAGTGYSKYNPDKELTWEGKPEDAIGVNVKKAGAVTLGKTIIEELTEDDISHPLKKCPSPGVESVRHGVESVRRDTGFKSNLEKDHKRMTRNYIATSDHHATGLRTSVDTASCQSSCGYQSETPNCNLDPALVVDVNHQYEEKQMNLKNMTGHADHRKSNLVNGFDIQRNSKKSNFRKALCDVTEASPNQKSLHAGLLNGNGNVYHSKDLMDTLSLPNINKESFLKFFEDPDLILKFHNARARNFSKLESGKILEGSDLSEKEEGCLEKYKELVSQKLSDKQNASLLMENKQKGTRSSKRSDTSLGLTRIVVLKPNLSGNPNPILFTPDNSKQSDYSLQHEEGTERVASHFLCCAIGKGKKEEVQIAMNGVLHRVPDRTKGSGNTDKRSAAENVECDLSNKTTCTVEHIAQSPIKRRNRRTELKECLPNMKCGSALKVDSYEKPTVVEGSRTIFHEDAKEHHALILGTGGGNELMCDEKTPSTLGLLLYWSDDDIQSLTPDKMRSSSTRKVIQDTPTKQLSPFQKKIESLLITDRKRDDGQHVLHTNNKSREDFFPEESMETIEAVDTICTEERDYSVVFSETGSKDSSSAGERCEDEGSSLLSVLAPVEERQQPVPSFISLSKRSLFAQNLEVPQVLTETPERPSPVSVLESFFFDNVNSPENTIREREVPLVLMGTPELQDPVSLVEMFFVDNINSPESITTKHDESSVEPRQSHFKEHGISAAVTLSGSEAMIVTHVKDVEFKYVRSLLQASGMSYDNLLERWHLSDSLLDPFLFDDTSISLSHLPSNRKLIYDCTNQVLVETLSRCFSCAPWLHFIEPNLQGDLLEDNLVQKVYKGILRHLHLQLECTLDQTIRKELDCGGWMKLRSETESILFDMSDDILEDLIQELY